MVEQIGSDAKAIDETYIEDMVTNDCNQRDRLKLVLIVACTRELQGNYETSSYRLAKFKQDSHHAMVALRPSHETPHP
jgi:hypothetical protein